MIGVHLSNLEIAPYTGPGARPLSAAEKIYLERNGSILARREWVQANPIDKAADARLRPN